MRSRRMASLRTGPAGGEVIGRGVVGRRGLELQQAVAEKAFVELLGVTPPGRAPGTRWKQFCGLSARRERLVGGACSTCGPHEWYRLVLADDTASAKPRPAAARLRIVPEERRR